MTIRKVIPLLWRYLLVVATSCLLAFFISRESRASMASGAEISTSASAANAVSYEASGRYDVETLKQSWEDAARKRVLPIHVVAPRVTAATVEAPFPVIVFSHGLGGSTAAGKRWSEHWASHGYIVVHIQHPGSDESIWKDAHPGQIEDNATGAMTMTNLGFRTGDVHFVVDEIMRRAKTNEMAFKFANVQRIGMSGHSFGAQTTLAIAGQSSGAARGQSGFDKRITAALAFSPNARNKVRMEKQFGDIRMPFFSITGTKDGAVLNDGTKPEDRELPFAFMPAGDKYLLVLDGGDHMVFSGQKIKRRRQLPTRHDEIQNDVKAASLAFWNAYLKDDIAAKTWLTAPQGSKSALQAQLATNDRFQMK
jgi:predicted dienelactone hydrolase